MNERTAAERVVIRSIFCKSLYLCVLKAYNVIIGGNHMKTKDLVILPKRNGWAFKRHGGNHDIYIKNGVRESIPRHRETDEDLAKAIISRRGLT
jgi:mRNA interferase HicA